MARHSPSKNQRSKGIKLKHVLQISVLVVVCLWLIYQVKHSHDKKKEFDGSNGEVSLNVRSGNEVLKFGRKDLNPQLEETSKENEKHDKESEEIEDEEEGNMHEEEEEEEERNKHVELQEEEESKLEDGVDEEEDNKTEEKEDEGRGGGNDEIEAQDQEKSDSNVDHEKDEEKERKEGEEKENEEKDVEHSDSQTEDENSLNDHDHDGGTRNTHEAREEHYKADDASSAVAHEAQTISAENENDSEATNTEIEDKVNNTEVSNIGQNTTGLNVQEGEMAENGTLTSAINEEKSSETFNSTNQGSSAQNSTITLESNDQPKLTNTSTETSAEFHGSSLKNGTEIIMSDQSHAQNPTDEDKTAESSNIQTATLDQINNSSIALDDSQSDSKATISNASENVEANGGVSSNSQFVASENTTQSNSSVETNDSDGSTIIEVNTDAMHNEMSDTSGGKEATDEGSDSSNTQNADEVQHETIDSSIEDREARIDPNALSDIRTELSNSEGAAEE